jgi:hypothetical protein
VHYAFYPGPVLRESWGMTVWMSGRISIGIKCRSRRWAIANALDDPIPLPGSRHHITLRDAATFITKLPKAKHDAPEWRVAVEALMLVAEKLAWIARHARWAAGRQRPSQGARPRRNIGSSDRHFSQRFACACGNGIGGHSLGGDLNVGALQCVGGWSSGRCTRA